MKTGKLFVLALAVLGGLLAGCNRRDDGPANPILEGRSGDTGGALAVVGEAVVPVVAQSSMGSALQTTPLLQDTTGTATIDTTLTLASGTVRVAGTNTVEQSTDGVRTVNLDLTAELDNVTVGTGTHTYTVSGTVDIAGSLAGVQGETGGANMGGNEGGSSSMTGQLQQTGALTVVGPGLDGEFPVDIRINVTGSEITWTGSLGDEATTGSASVTPSAGS
jgi:hypothetical protein